MTDKQDRKQDRQEAKACRDAKAAKLKPRRVMRMVDGKLKSA